jgi:uncharacterized protein (DUF1810 family)
MARFDDLQRFIDAQEPVYARVCDELRAGLKSSHWMWFVFPQLKGLGRSATAEHFGISSAGEAVAYLQHPVLGARLRECARLVLAVQGRSAEQIFGAVDALKLRSSMTLFAEVAPDDPLFRQVLDQYYGGLPDPRTVDLLRDSEQSRS